MIVERVFAEGLVASSIWISQREECTVAAGQCGGNFPFSTLPTFGAE